MISFEIVSVEWHENGKYLASSGNVHDRQIIIWDTKRNVQIATSRLNSEPKQMMFYHKNLITLGKGMIRYWNVPETTSNFPMALNGRNVALKTRREATFVDMTATNSALFVVSHEVSDCIGYTVAAYSIHDHFHNDSNKLRALES